MRKECEERVGVRQRHEDHRDDRPQPEAVPDTDGGRRSQRLREFERRRFARPPAHPRARDDHDEVSVCQAAPSLPVSAAL